MLIPLSCRKVDQALPPGCKEQDYDRHQSYIAVVVVERHISSWPWPAKVGWHSLLSSPGLR